MRDHPYKPLPVGEGEGRLRQGEAERSSFALGYFIGRTYWQTDIPLSQNERTIKEADSLAYWAGYDLGTFHWRQGEHKIRKDWACQPASDDIDYQHGK